MKHELRVSACDKSGMFTCVTAEADSCGILEETSAAAGSQQPLGHAPEILQANRHVMCIP